MKPSKSRLETLAWIGSGGTLKVLPVRSRPQLFSRVAVNTQEGRNGGLMADERQEARGGVAASISTGLVQLHKQFYGKGPTKAKTYLVNDTVICMLKEGLTRVERTMLESGKPEVVHNMRRSFQDAMQDRFTAVVEEATGRAVIAYMSNIHCDPDISLEVFVLEPGPEPLADKHEADLGGEPEGDTPPV